MLPLAVPKRSFRRRCVNTACFHNLAVAKLTVTVSVDGADSVTVKSAGTVGTIEPSGSRTLTSLIEIAGTTTATTSAMLGCKAPAPEYAAVTV